MLPCSRRSGRELLGKVAIIDWDVHHGNGTQHIYLQRDAPAYAS
ncbi:hypothetical protein, partial [Klebsiella pneumoniae]